MRTVGMRTKTLWFSQLATKLKRFNTVTIFFYYHKKTIKWRHILTSTFFVKKISNLLLFLFLTLSLSYSLPLSLSQSHSRFQRPVQKSFFLKWKKSVEILTFQWFFFPCCNRRLGSFFSHFLFFEKNANCFFSHHHSKDLFVLTLAKVIT